MTHKEYEPVHYEVDTLLIELGFSLIHLVDEKNGVILHEQINGLRQQMGLELGLKIPKVRIIDNIELKPSEYCIKLKGVEAGRAILKKNEAKHAGYKITTHLSEIIKCNAVDLFGLQDTQNILDKLRDKYPTVVEEVTKESSCLRIVQIWKIFQGLLKENVSIRNMPSILEAIAEYAPVTSEIWFHIKKAREALARQICSQYASENRTLHIMTLDPIFEQKILDSKCHNPAIGDIFSVLEPAFHNAWIKALGKMVKLSHEKGHTPVILCSAHARYLVRTALEREFPEVAVLSVSEIANDFNVKSSGVIIKENETKVKITKGNRVSGRAFWV